MCTMFFALVILFAGIIVSAGRMDNECSRIGGEPFGHAASDFADAFALSWTTFSTVGYGRYVWYDSVLVYVSAEPVMIISLKYLLFCKILHLAVPIQRLAMKIPIGRIVPI